MIDALRNEYPVALLCRLIGLPRSSYYYPLHATDETAVVTALEHRLMRWPFYGYRQLVAQLQREGFTWVSAWCGDSPAVAHESQCRACAPHHH